MNRLMRIANPAFVLALICAFVYVYFFYLMDAAPPSLNVPAAKTEQMKDWDEVPPKDPNVVPMTGPVVRQQYPPNPIGRQNPVQQPNQTEAPQGNPDLIASQPQTQSVPLAPIPVPDKTLQEGPVVRQQYPV